MRDATDGDATTSGETPSEVIHTGMAVHDARGERIGSIENAEPSKGYAEVKTGNVFGRNLYIPLDTVARVDEGGIHLKVAKDDLDRLDWYLPPTNGVDLDTPYSPSPSIETGYGQGERSVPPGERDRKLERDEQSGIQPSPSPEVASGVRPYETHETTDTLPQSLAPTAPGPSDAETTIAVPVFEEHLEARTRADPAGAGTAHVRTVITSELQSLDVPVTHDELLVERVPMRDSGASAGILGPDVFTEKDMDVPLMGEQVELEKRTRVTEEVVLRKRQVTQQRTVTGEVRKERVSVEGAGDGETGPAGIGERDIGDEDTITYDRLAQDQDWPDAYRH